MNTNLMLRFAIGAVLAAATATPVLAEEATGGLEEITVTAQRRSERLQETPVSVSALSADMLEAQGIDSLQSVGKSVPNLVMQPISANPSAMQVSLRGGVEQTGGLIVSEPAVALYVDDVYRARLQGSNMQLADIERIEVLRGPQGTLYGRNSFSGAVKIVTRTPSKDNSWFDLGLGAGSFATKQASITAGGGLTDTLGASFSAMFREQSEGYVWNPAQNRNIGAEKNSVLRGKLAYRSGPWSVDFSASYSNDSNDGWIPLAVSFVPPSVPRSASAGLSSDQAVPRVGTDPYVTVYPQPSKGETTTNTATLDITHDFGNVKVRSITGWVKLEDFFRFDLAGGIVSAPGVYTTGFDRKSDSNAKEVTEELQVLGTAANDRVNWIVGGYYFKETADQKITDNLPMYFLFNLDPTLLDADTKSYAAYGQASWKFTDALTATVGLRYTRDSKQFVGSIQTGFGAPNPRTTVTNDRTFTKTTPKIGLDWKISDDLFAYASASKGFKAGGYNGLAVFNATAFRAVYEPQEVKAYEVGLKSEWFGRKLRANFAAFWNDITALQQTGAVGGGSFAVQNVGDASVKGFEAELTWLPVEGLTVYANLGLSDQKYTSRPPTSRALQYGAKDLPVLPSMTDQLGFTYEVPVSSSLKFKLGADMYGSSSYYTEIQNILKIEGYQRYDAFIGLGSADGKWDVTLAGKNLSDELTFVSGVIDLLNTNTQSLSALRPREYALSFKYHVK
jgi:iron complex outermembrane receptor protein